MLISASAVLSVNLYCGISSLQIIEWIEEECSEIHISSYNLAILAFEFDHVSAGLN